MNYETKTLLLSDLTLDTDLQPRTKRNKTLSAHFAGLVLSNEDHFPPLIVFQDGETFYLADGFHRFHAYDANYRKQAQCHVYQGSKRDALLYSVGANGTHGLNMTNADKRRAVTKLLEDPEWSKWGDREIARRCHVDHSFVGKMRKSLASNHSEIPQERTYSNKHGGVSVMNTANIGKRADQGAEVTQPQGADQSCCNQSCAQTINGLNERVLALQAELEMKDALISDLENQLAKFREDESFPC
jgi:hypothetical protein